MQPTRDHLLPVDPEAYRRAVHPRGRIIVIAPTRAACETIELALGLTDVETILEREHGAELRELARSGKGFGIVAGTGTGKTLGIRPIAEAILEQPLRVGVVNREREATPDTPSWNVVIVTTGIARRWFEDDLITGRDTIVADEIHQTSAELELCLSLGKRAGCRFIWLSATVDPAFYARYLNSAEVVESSAFDPRLKARVKVLPQKAEEFLDDKFIRHLIRAKRGVAVFVPTRAEVEQLAKGLGERWPKLNAAFYHGGEPIRVIRPFLEGEGQHPFLLAMTAAGQSALNIRGLDTVVIYDARYGNVVDRGRNVLHRMYLGANEILQMAGRVHGRVPDGEVYILTDRDLVFEKLRPTPPEFQLAGDAERVAITCAALGVDATDLDLPVPLDRIAYKKALYQLTDRGLVEDGKLTRYGRQVEAMPVDRAWGELLVHASADLAPVVAVCSNIESLHRMTREEKDLEGVRVNGSDHLTAYNLFAEAVNRHGALGEVYGLPRHLFDEEGLADWAEKRGVLVKAIEDVALGTASVYRAMELELPRKFPYAGRELREGWFDLLAQIMPLDLVIDERTADGQEARVSRNSMAGNWGAVAGNIRYFADRYGTPRAAIEGTTLSYDLIRRYARKGPAEIEIGGPRKHPQLIVRRKLTYFGFELDAEVEPLGQDLPAELLPALRDALATAMLAGETPHPSQNRVRRSAAELSEFWRRSGGKISAAAPEAIKGAIVEQLAGVSDWQKFLATPIRLEVESRVPQSDRDRLASLPDNVRLFGDTVSIHYEVGPDGGVARLRLREGQARRLRQEDVPRLDRPVRLAVMRGQQQSLEADSVDDLRAALNRADAEERRNRRFKPPRHQRGRGRRR